MSLTREPPFAITTTDCIDPNVTRAENCNYKLNNYTYTYICYFDIVILTQNFLAIYRKQYFTCVF